MRPKGDNKVGRFSIEFEVANYQDVIDAERAMIEPSKVRRTTIRGVVDPGAAELVLPGAVAKQLGLPKHGKIRVRYADRRTAKRDTVKDVYVEIQGRDGSFRAIVEPKRDSALIGAIVLEDLDFLVDSKHQRLVPRDPDIRIGDIGSDM